MQSACQIDFSKIDKIISDCGGQKSNLIAILQKVQEVYRYLPEDAMTYIGTKVEGLSPATVYGVATFYAQFSLEPKGKYEIRACDGTACHVRGSLGILERVISELKLQSGEVTTPDLRFTIEPVACIGACGLAPCVMVDDETHGRLTKDKVPDMLSKYE